MTEKEIRKALGCLVLFRRNKQWFKGRLIYVFDNPAGFIPGNQSVVIYRPDRKSIVFLKEIYYIFPHYNKKIKLYNEPSLQKLIKDASTARQYAIAKLERGQS